MKKILLTIALLLSTSVFAGSSGEIGISVVIPERDEAVEAQAGPPPTGPRTIYRRFTRNCTDCSDAELRRIIIREMRYDTQGDGPPHPAPCEDRDCWDRGPSHIYTYTFKEKHPNGCGDILHKYRGTAYWDRPYKIYVQRLN